MNRRRPELNVARRERDRRAKERKPGTLELSIHFDIDNKKFEDLPEDWEAQLRAQLHWTLLGVFNWDTSHYKFTPWEDGKIPNKFWDVERFLEGFRKHMGEARQLAGREFRTTTSIDHYFRQAFMHGCANLEAICDQLLGYPG